MNEDTVLNLIQPPEDGANLVYVSRGICAACGRASNITVGYHCLNRPVLSDGFELLPLAEGWCGRDDHITELCGECINAMFRENPPSEKPIIVVDKMPAHPCNRFEYMLRNALDANRNSERNRLESIRNLYKPQQIEPEKAKIIRMNRQI